MTSNDESITSSFKDNFSYIAAFLSVLIGLAAFKDEAESYSLRIINWDFSILALALPFIFSMILATYVGALAIQSRTMNFTLFPLVKILELIANAFALIGLAYPILILLTSAFTLLANYIISHVPYSGSSEVFSAILSGLGTTISTAIATNLIVKIAKSRLKDKYDKKSEELLLEYANLTNTVHTTGKMNIITQYIALTNLAKWILRLKGYSITGDSLYYASRKLADLGIFDKTDLAKIEDVHTVRNAIAHSTEPPAAKTIKETEKKIVELAEKLRGALIEDSGGSTL